DRRGVDDRPARRLAIHAARDPAVVAEDPMKRSSERGSAMLVTMIITVALIAGAATVVQMQLSSLSAAQIQRAQLSSLYCAEAGLEMARTVVAANYAQWAGSLGTGTEPAWLAAGIGSHDL